jgi:hypothetical protein
MAASKQLFVCRVTAGQIFGTLRTNAAIPRDEIALLRWDDATAHCSLVQFPNVINGCAIRGFEHAIPVWKSAQLPCAKKCGGEWPTSDPIS